MWRFSPVTLTAIYAVYAFGALAALLTTGRLSDHVGRRRVLIVGLLIQCAGMLSFIVAQGAEGLFAARFVQGVGTGTATGAVSAWLLDLRPPERPRLGGTVGGIALVAGLASGALVSGLLVEYGPDPLHLVYWLLTAFFGIALAATFAIPDPVERRAGWLQSMRPMIGIPANARALFAASTPTLIATWAVGGLYLSLGPSLATSLLQSDGRLAGGLVITALFGASALASASVQAIDPRKAVVGGSLVLIVGVAITLSAVAVSSAVWLYAGSAIAGLGLGPAFSGVLRGLAPLAPPDKRGALLASIYVVVYLAFSVPAIIAGVAVTRYGLLATTFAYCSVVMVLAAITTVSVLRRPSVNAAI